MKLIAVGGIDGSGKTTAALALARRLNGAYRKQRIGSRFEALFARGGAPPAEPTSYGQDLSLAYALDFSDYAKRYGLRDTQAPFVIADRWKLCVQAFARVFGTCELSVTALIDAVPEPDLYIILDVSPDRAIQRLRQRGPLDWDESEAILGRLRIAYSSLAAAKHNCRIVDAHGKKTDVRLASLQLVANR